MVGIPVILDCDPGHDDAMAILLALANEAIDLLLITTVAGNQTLDKTYLNAHRICSAAGVTNIPIVAGCDRPLASELTIGSFIHGESGLDGWDFAPESLPLQKQHGVLVMRDALIESLEPVTIIATGPLTNVATLLQGHPEVYSSIREIVFMGGSTERGNVAPYAEFNVAVDPEAAALVLGSGIPITMCGLNVTHSVLVTDKIIERLEALHTPLARVCIDLMTFFTRTYRDVFGFQYPPLHDPVAVAKVIDPTLIGCTPSHVAIELNGQYTRGATVVDLDRRLGLPVNANVAVSINSDGFWDLIVNAIDELR